MWPRLEGLRTVELGEPGPMRDRLNELVLAGEKRATAGLWRLDYEPAEERVEEVGERLVLLDSDGQSLALVEVTRIEIHPFAAVPWEFTQAEGEGFTSPENWRHEHRAFYAREGHGVEDDDRVVCVWFDVIDATTKR